MRNDDLGLCVLRWYASGDTGISSIALCHRLTGYLATDSWKYNSEPSDGDDFGGCVRMLAAIPGLRARLAEAVDLSPEWARLIARWDEIEALHRAEQVALPGKWSRKTYALMSEIRFPKSAA